MLAAVLCTVLWGSAYPVIKYGYREIEIATVADKLMFAGARFVLAGLMVFVFAWCKNRRVPTVPRDRVGGVLLYGTCTICRAENTENAAFIREQLPFESVDLRPQLPEILQNEASAPEGWLQLLPGVHPSDGFFVAKFRRQQG